MFQSVHKHTLHVFNIINPDKKTLGREYFFFTLSSET